MWFCPNESAQRLREQLHSLRSQAIGVARGDAIFGGHPFGFEQGMLGQAHENGIEGARLQSCFAAQFVSVAPSGGAVEEALEKKEGLRRKAGRFHE